MMKPRLLAYFFDALCLAPPHPPTPSPGRLPNTHHPLPIDPARRQAQHPTTGGTRFAAAAAAGGRGGVVVVVGEALGVVEVCQEARFHH